ncbi:carboxymuconolactone decarboxylase family protein [Klebsiella quasipneumoniae]
MAYSEVEHYLSHCGLDEHLLDLVYLRVSQLNGCAFCTDLHTRMLTKAGIGPEKLALVQVWAHSGQLFSATEKAALAWAEHVTLIAGPAARRGSHPGNASLFTEKELFDLTLAISLMNAWNRLAISFRNVPQSAAEHKV